MRMSKQRVLCCAAGILAIAWFIYPVDALSYGSRCVFIGPNGSDVTGNGTYSNPFHSLSKAEDYLSVGAKDTIVVLTGTYNSSNQYWGVLQELRGTPSNWVTIMGETGRPKPVLDGLPLIITATYSEVSDSLHYFRIQDLVIQNTPLHCINIYDKEYANPRPPVRYVELSGIEMYNAGYAGFKMARVSNFTIRDCVYEDAKSYDYPGIGFDMVCCRHGLIEDCKLINLGYRCVMNSWMSSGFMIKGGSYDITVRDCFVDHVYAACLAGQTTGWDYFYPPLGSLDDDGEVINYEAKDIRYYSNIIVNASIALTCSNDIRTRFEHNTFYNPVDIIGEGGGQLYPSIYFVLLKDYWQGDARMVKSQYGEIKNNLAVFGRMYHDYIVWCQDSGNLFSTFKFYNDLFYCMSNPLYSTPLWSTIVQYYANGMCDTLDNVYGKNPLLTNPANGDFSISSPSSPAVGVGPYLAEVSNDFFDRPYAYPNATLGALEYSAVAPAAPVPPQINIQIR